MDHFKLPCGLWNEHTRSLHNFVKKEENLLDGMRLCLRKKDIKDFKAFNVAPLAACQQ